MEYLKKKGTRQATTVFGQKQRVLITSTPNLPTAAEQPEEIVFFFPYNKWQKRLEKVMVVKQRRWKEHACMFITGIRQVVSFEWMTERWKKRRKENKKSFLDQPFFLVLFFLFMYLVFVIKLTRSWLPDGLTTILPTVFLDMLTIPQRKRE